VCQSAHAISSSIPHRFQLAFLLFYDHNIFCLLNHHKSCVSIFSSSTFCKTCRVAWKSLLLHSYTRTRKRKEGETLIAQQVSLLQQHRRSLMTSLFPLDLTICWLPIINSIHKVLQRPRCWEYYVISQSSVIKTWLKIYASLSEPHQ